MRAKKLITVFAALFALTMFSSCSDEDVQDVYVTNSEESGDLVYKRYNGSKSSTATPDYVHVKWTKAANSNYTEYDINGAGKFYKIGGKFYTTSYESASSKFKGEPGSSSFEYYESGYYNGLQDIYTQSPTYTYEKF